MKTICIFSAQYLPHLGGVERYTYNLARYLRRKGDKVVIVTSNIQNLDAYEIMEGIEVFRLPCMSLLDGRYPVLKCNYKFWKIHQQLLSRKFDLILVNTRFYLHSVYGAILAKLMKTKCIMIDHGTGHLSVHNKFGNIVSELVEHTITKIDKFLCKDFYGVSIASTKWLQHFHIQAKGVLYNAVDLEKIEEIKNKKMRNFRSEYNIPKEAYIVAFTGRLLKEKGIWQLIHAVQEMRNEGINLYLLIAGEGDEKEEIKNTITPETILLGRLKFEDVVGLLMQSDIFCLPSDSEGFSTSVLEAAVCNCFVITTENGGSKELISSSEYGKIIPDNKIETIKEALSSSLLAPDYRKRATIHAYDKVKNNFTWDIISDQVRMLYL